MVDENQLLAEVKPYLEKGRPGDYQHTLDVVKTLKEFLKTEQGDPDVLIPAAYLHDIGYSGIYGGVKKLEKGSWHDKLEEHMKTGKEISVEILTRLGYSSNLVERISWMVSVHDDWYNQNDPELGILMDADNLSKLDVEHIKKKWDEPRDVIEMWEQDMPRRLKTNTGKTRYSELMPEIKKELGLD